MPKLPTLNELEMIRSYRITTAIENGMIDKIRKVIDYYGKPLEVKHWTGNFKELYQDGFIFKLYEQLGRYSPSLQRSLLTTTIHIANLHHLDFVHLTRKEPYYGISEKDLYVSGKWELVILRYYELLTSIEADKQAGIELSLRKQLATRLQIKFDTK